MFSFLWKEIFHEPFVFYVKFESSNLSKIMEELKIKSEDNFCFYVNVNICAFEIDGVVRHSEKIGAEHIGLLSSVNLLSRPGKLWDCDVSYSREEEKLSLILNGVTIDFHLKKKKLGSIFNSYQTLQRIDNLLAI